MIIELNNVKYEVEFTRRRYGNQCYTWVDYFISPDGVRYGPKDGLCDPFPCVIPKRSELIELLKQFMETGDKWIWVRKDRPPFKVRVFLN